MAGVLVLSLFQRRLGTHQAADYIPLIASSLIDVFVSQKTSSICAKEWGAS